jgi:RHS repeat-associated protein
MTVGGETTTYTLDLAAPLVQVLMANEAGDSTVYLYGVTRIGEDDGSWLYYLADHLGSVRSLVDGDSNVDGTRSYQPYGLPLGSAGTATSIYGFTGEQTDPTGLVYLRARMYAPSLRQFTGRDPWGGDAFYPATFNGFNYADANPVNMTDPTGLSPQVICREICDRWFDLAICECYCDWWSRQNHRDLTSWLVREMNANAKDSAISAMWQWHVEFDRLVHQNLITKISFYPGYLYYDTLIQPTRVADWINLVKDGGRWDFKDRIQRELGDNVWLQTGGNGAGGWFEYSVTGNIHYGYVGRAAGFTALDLHLGASYAEITDPEHAERGEQNFCVEFFGVRKCGYFNPAWRITFYDHPLDFNAVEFGSMLFDIFRWHIPVQAFANLIGAYGHLLAQGSTPIDLGSFVNPSWPYPLRYFDNPGN